MGKVGEGVPIGEGDNEAAKVDVRTRRRRKRAPPRVPAISPCRRVGEEEEAGEVDADVEVEAQGRRAVGDTIPISDRAKENDAAASLVVPLGCT